MKNNDVKPNFFIIGAPKCGTTSLATWLAEHPQIYMSPIKEPFYYSRDINYQLIFKWQDYITLFSDSLPKHIAMGEASTTYLFSKVAVPTIERQLPGSRYIALLRNPVDMAYALHQQRIRSLHEDVIDFYKAWKLSPERRRGNCAPPGCDDPVLLDYQSWCRLGEQLERLLRRVSRERVLVLILDDIRNDAQKNYLETLKFLSVPDDGRVKFPVYNSSREWWTPLLGKALRALGKQITWARYTAHILPQHGIGTMRFLEKFSMRKRPRLPLSLEIREELEDFYLEDIKLLEGLLGRSFQSWLVHGISE